jgi:membrane protein
MFGTEHIRLVKLAAIEAGRAILSQRISLVAAGCAFYATLALFPAITTLISLYGLVFNPHTVQPQLAYLRRLMPPEAYGLISDRIQALVSQPAKGLGFGLFISVLITLWSASAGTKSILNALTIAYRQRDNRGIIEFQLIAMGMTLLAILGACLAIAVLVLLPVLLAFVGFGDYTRILASIGGFAGMVAFVVIALGLLYRYGPAGEGRIFFAPGAGVATFMWLLGSWIFGLYVGRFAAYDATYGPLATLIGLMMWFYLTAYAVLLGAELNAALDHEWRMATKIHARLGADKQGQPG